MKNKLRISGWLVLFLAMGLNGLGVRSAFSAASVPLTEEFLEATLPGSPFDFNSSPEGRIAIVADSTLPMVENSLPVGYFLFTSRYTATGGTRSKGNYYRCDSDAVLYSQAITLGRAAAAEVTFTVYESTTSNGVYAAVASNTVSASVGTNEVSSGEMNVPLRPGRFYLMSAGWDNPCTYTYLSPGTHPDSTLFGESFSGYTQTGYPPAQSVSNSFTSILYFQKLVVSTNMVVRMDDSVDGGATSTNQMDVAVNLAGYADATLEFRHRASGDEANTEEGVYFSEDGSSFTKVYSLPNGTTGWQTLSLDIDALAAANGLSLTDTFMIRFQQVDGHGWPLDGREFDDIMVYTDPDLRAISLGASGSTGVTNLWKGFSSTKTIPVSFSVQERGSKNTVSYSPVRFGYTLNDAGGTARGYSYNSYTWTFEAMESQNHTLNATVSIPAATHLPDLNYTVTAYADETGIVPEAIETNNDKSLDIVVNHYSGWLWFDDVKADITISDWGTRVANSPSEHWISGTGTIGGESFSFTNLKVDKNLTTLDYSLDPTETTVINVPFPNRRVVNGVTYWLVSGVDLSKSGAYSDVKVLLPAGMGISTVSTPVQSPIYTFPNEKLRQELYPDSVVDAFDTFYITEETKPVTYTVTSMEWDPTAGTFAFTHDGVSFVREPFLLSLEAYASLMEDPAMAEKKSNSGYYRGVVQMQDDILVDTGANGDARLSTTIEIDPVPMVAHFPYGVSQNWNYGVFLKMEQDLVDTSSSSFNDLAPCSVSYARDCNDGIPCTGSAGDGSVALSAAGRTYVGPNGGLVTDVNIDSGGAISWGSRSDGSFVQQMGSFNDGTLYISGHFIRGDQSGFDATDQFGPAEILLSGMLGSTPERPSLANYADGFGEYAGLNLRVGIDSRTSVSRIGGSATPSWPLSSRSKYYLRSSGVSGIHEAATFKETMTVYGYPFGFSNLGLSYLSGEPQESRINGEVAVVDPCDIQMDFEELMLDCVGELEEAELANSDTKTLVYWDADIQPLSLFFAPTASSSCGNQARKLCMGLTTQCANVDQVLSGVLGFLPTGELAAPADGIDGVPSRLASPNKIELDGPGSETYYFNPVANPYYNDYSESGDGPTDRGWINFAGNVDVSFFSDLQVQLHTSASTNSAVANIYMMGGWKEGSDSFFTTGDPDGFDLLNRGFPPAPTTYLDYRNPSTDSYRVHAMRTWLGVIDFDYPLEWSAATKAFKSPEELEEDLLVVQVQHQTDYLSAERTEISFGLQYDGLPQINLANMAFNAVDEATGMASAFTDAVGEGIHDAIDDGLDAFNDTLSDLPEQLFDPVFERVLDPMVDEFYTDLYNAYMAQPTATDYGTVVTQYLYGVAGPTYDNLGVIISNLANTTDGAINLLGEIDSNLDQAVQLINAFADVVSMTNGVMLPTNSCLQGLLHVDGGDYQMLADLGVGILETLAETLYDSIKGTIEDEMTEVLSSVAPSLESITEVLLDLRDVIEDVQARLDTAGSVAAELSSVLHSPLVSDTLDTVANEIMRQMEDLSSGDSTFDEYTPEEVKAMLRTYITDAFYSSVPCADVQQVIRSQLYEVESMVQESIDSALQQLNQAMKDLVSEFLSGIDEEINGMLGDLSDIMGAGQIDGYAHIRNDALNELRLDGKFQWKVPDEMEFNAYLVIKDLNSSLPGGCGIDADSLPEVTLGTTDFGLGMLGSDIRADISTKFAFAENSGSLTLIGMGGSFEMTEGEIGFESFAIDEFYAAVAFGALENYLSANVHCTFTSYEVEGGIFLGKACSLDPFSWDPDVQAVLGDPPFLGIYVYGEGWMPIVDYGCLFRVKAGVGAGIFYFVDGPVGGKIFLGADGEALCVVNVSGEVTLVGVKDGDDMRMNGKGKISGRAGSCPFCVKFSKTVTISYDNGEWDADY